MYDAQAGLREFCHLRKYYPRPAFSNQAYPLIFYRVPQEEEKLLFTENSNSINIC